jgi:Membrane proteins related to metalloendopeptidases
MGGKLKFSDEETDKTESAGKPDPPAGRKPKPKKTVSAKSRNKKVLKTDADTDDSVKPTEPKSKLKLSKDEKSKVKDEKRTLKQDKKISKLEHKIEKYSEKRDKARIKQPTRKKKVKERFYDESKDKAQTKIRFETEPIPISEAKWNKPKKRSLPVKGVAALTTAGVNKAHLKVYEAEHENVGTQAAHRAELVGESAVHGGKRLIHETYRFAKNTPYRQSAKFETKLIQTNMKLEYERAVKENPKLKSNKLSQFMQRKRIKRKYADAFRNAKKSGETLKKSGSVLTKVAATVTKIIRRNPVFLLKAGLLLLIVFAVLSMFTMCMGMFSNITGILSFACYSADDTDIDQAELSYTEWETDLEIEILNVETTYSGYDEYRYDIGSIGHDPYELMAFLTAVYADFTYSDVESALREIFDGQYTLEFVPETEIWTRTETHTGVYTDDDGNEVIYEYEVEVEYEYHILNVTLTAVSFMEILLPLMTEEQIQHFNILMQTKGGRQYGASPFDVNWLSHVTSKYGYRVHPITGLKDYHKGIDIAFPLGTEILAGLDGTVTTAAYDGSYGNYIVISDGEGLEMKYAHCQTLLVSAGQPVSKGDVIATVGSTGDSTGNHLHMEILKDGNHINPIYFVETN